MFRSSGLARIPGLKNYLRFTPISASGCARSLHECKTHRLDARWNAKSTVIGPGLGSPSLDLLSGRRWKTTQSTGPSSQEPKEDNNNSEALRFLFENVNENEYRGPIKIESEDQQYTGFEMPQIVDPEPLKAMDLRRKIVRITKHAPFMYNTFIGEFDKDFLIYPEFLRSRFEVIHVREQQETAKMLWKQSFWTNEKALSDFNFYDLHRMTVSEMCNVLESVGYASRKQEDEKLLTVVDGNTPAETMESAYSAFRQRQARETQAILKIVTQNALSWMALQRSDNQPLHEKLLRMQACAEKKIKIGYAFCERESKLGAQDYPDWQCRAKLSNDEKYWVLTGTKGRILADNYDFYLVSALTHDSPGRLSEAYLHEQETPYDSVVTLLVPADLVHVQDDGSDSAGNRYLRIICDDLLLPREETEVLKPDPNPALSPIEPLNVKGCGQLGVAAVILGQLKAQQKHVYEFLINHKRPLIDCNIVEYQLGQITQKIYCIESMVYLVSAMFDAFAPGMDAHLECATVKTLAVDYARDVNRLVQSLYGSHLLVTSHYDDQVNIWDSFMDTSMHNRIYVAANGLKLSGKWKHDDVNRRRLGQFYPIYQLKHYLKEHRNYKDDVKFEWDLASHLHPDFDVQAQYLEYCTKRLDWATNVLFTKFGKVVLEEQTCLYRLSQIAMDLFMTTCVVSRASRSSCEALRNHDMEFNVSMSVTMDTMLKTRRLVEEISLAPLGVNDGRIHHVHNRNAKFGGYFADHPMSKNL